MAITISPTEEVIPTPINPITSAGVIAPLADVAETPVRPRIKSSREILPTEEVAETPVIVPLKLEIAVGEPTLEVAPTPVKPITSATSKTYSPPQEFSPQS